MSHNNSLTTGGGGVAPYSTYTMNPKFNPYLSNKNQQIMGYNMPPNGKEYHLRQGAPICFRSKSSKPSTTLNHPNTTNNFNQAEEMAMNGGGHFTMPKNSIKEVGGGENQAQMQIA